MSDKDIFAGAALTSMIAGMVAFAGPVYAQSITHNAANCGDTSAGTQVTVNISGYAPVPDGTLPLDTVFGASYDAPSQTCTIPTNVDGNSNAFPGSFLLGTLNQTLLASNNFPLINGGPGVIVSFDYSDDATKSFIVDATGEPLNVLNSNITLAGNGTVNGTGTAILVSGRPSIVSVN